MSTEVKVICSNNNETATVYGRGKALLPQIINELTSGT